MDAFQYDPPMDAARVLLRDDAVLVVSKPAGLLSVPGRLEKHRDSLLTRLQADDPEVRLVHRLDMDTSGVMVFARTAEAQRTLSAGFAERVVEKVYRAWVAGSVEGSGEVDLPLIVDWPRRPLQKVCFETGKPALTRWRVLRREAGRSLLELRPETGRSHQLRVHMAEAVAPILGDRFYGQADAPRLMLHAWGLGFDHPVTGARVWVEDPAQAFSLEGV